MGAGVEAIVLQSRRGLIESEADIARGMAALARKCSIMKEIRARAGLPPLRRDRAGFEGLSRIIVGQQLSIASAAAIWGRLSERVTPFEPTCLNACTDVELKSVGLSAGKIRTLRALSRALVECDLDLAELAKLDDGGVHDRLCAVNGIGPWTADIYIMFCIGRADAFAAGDLALRVAVQQTMHLEDKPSAQELFEIAERWRPWRGVAARALWAHYGQQKAGGRLAPV